MQLKVVAVIQARMGSTRLPGKVLMDISGKPMLARVVERLSRAKRLCETIVATTSKTSDDPIVQLCHENAWAYFRGSDTDVLDRYFHGSMAFQADVVVRITSDCPLVDPTIVDKLVRIFLAGQQVFDYVSNNHPPSYPRGMDVEVIRFSALKQAWEEDTNFAWREHVTPYIRLHPEMFKLYNVKSDCDFSTMRWTVDTPEDLEFVRTIYSHFGHDAFSWLEVLLALEKHTEWLTINSHVKQKPDPT